MDHGLEELSAYAITWTQYFEKMMLFLKRPRPLRKFQDCVAPSHETESKFSSAFSYSFITTSAGNYLATVGIIFFLLLYSATVGRVISRHSWHHFFCCIPPLSAELSLAVSRVISISSHCFDPRHHCYHLFHCRCRPIDWCLLFFLMLSIFRPQKIYDHTQEILIAHNLASHTIGW